MSNTEKPCPKCGRYHKADAVINEHLHELFEDAPPTSPESEIDATLKIVLGGQYIENCDYSVEIAALSRLIEAEVRRARQEQIMQDYLAFSQITGTDESEFIEVREELLADLEADSGEADHGDSNTHSEIAS